jgi:hypothetical protein
LLYGKQNSINQMAVGKKRREIKERQMSTFQRFAIGGVGGLLPIIVSLVSFNTASVIDHLDLLTPGIYIGYFIKVIALFALGGIVAAFSDTTRPWDLLVLGIAAPALITAYINGAGVSGPTNNVRQETSSIAVISSAYAAEASGHVPIVSVGFLGDVVRGATVPLPKIQREKQQEKQPQPPQRSPAAPPARNPPPQPQ